MTDIAFKIFKGEQLIDYDNSIHTSYNLLFSSISNCLGGIKKSSKLEIIWIDLAQLIINENFKNIFPNLNEKFEGNVFVPRVFIGSQKIEDFVNSNVSTVKPEKLKYIQFKRIHQLDHCIWNYYLPLVGTQVQFEKSLISIIDEININYIHGLYYSRVTYEYYDTYIRLCNQNYLNGGHSSQVIPFIFQSRSMALDKFKKLDMIKSHSDALTINVLLVDDFADTALEPFKANEEFKNKTKKEILEELWERKCTQNAIKLSLNIKSISEPNIALMGEFIPDIILLDYNFHNDKNGIDFFTELIENAKYKGPFEKYWIFPISSFNNAFLDELRLAGHAFSSDVYKLSRGADLVNTPEAFYYEFCKMVDSILNIAFRTKKDIDDLNKKISEAKDWKEVLNSTSNSANYIMQYTEHIKNKNLVDTFIQAEQGLLASIKLSNSANWEEFNNAVFYYEQLLYNLAYRNYSGNEEILIWHDILNNN
jgi:hypothetical protein